MLEEYTLIFQTLMLDVLQRRSLFRSFEDSLKGKRDISDNLFVHFYAADYLRSQLTDLRKFFENDARSYKLSFVLGHLNDVSIKREYKDIFDKKWKNAGTSSVNLSDIANKAFMHKEVEFNIPGGVQTQQLDSFIDELNNFINELVSKLTDEKFQVSFLDRSPDSDFLKNQQPKDFKEFLDVANQS